MQSRSPAARPAARETFTTARYPLSHAAADQNRIIGAPRPRGLRSPAQDPAAVEARSSSAGRAPGRGATQEAPDTRCRRLLKIEAEPARASEGVLYSIASRAAARPALAVRRKRKAPTAFFGASSFALFAFFVELVPYLPSYGGYVRYAVGIGITALVGRYAIVALNRYLERQKLAEALPDQERRKELSYDVDLARLAKSVCPGCERPVDLKNEKIDFCPHCGIGLFDHCGACSARKSAFARFCHACGTVAGVRLAREE